VHGKDEVDHVGGLVKTSLKRLVRAQDFQYKTSQEICEKITSLKYKIPMLMYTLSSDHIMSLMDFKSQPDKVNYREVCEKRVHLKIIPDLKWSYYFKVHTFISTLPV